MSTLDRVNNFSNSFGYFVTAITVVLMLVGWNVRWQWVIAGYGLNLLYSGTRLWMAPK